MIKKRKPKSKNYFTQETEDYIVLYNNSKDFEERSRIYERHIHYAFFKLTQNIIHTFKFYHTEVEELEHLQHEIITFLLSNIHLFDPSRGAKAYMNVQEGGVYKFSFGKTKEELNFENLL